jgi:hypothetical protein
MEARKKQIERFKHNANYQLLKHLAPQSLPRAPNVTINASTRRFRGLVLAWQKRVHMEANRLRSLLQIPPPFKSAHHYPRLP